MEDTPADDAPDLVHDDSEVFDFGKAKMEFFKQRARQILVDDAIVDQDYGDPAKSEMAYEG
mgnify:FL=1